MWGPSCASYNIDQHLWPTLDSSGTPGHIPNCDNQSISKHGQISSGGGDTAKSLKTLLWTDPRSRGPEGASAGRKGTKSQICAQVFSHVISLLLPVLCDKNHHYSDFKGDESEAQRRQMTCSGHKAKLPAGLQTQACLTPLASSSYSPLVPLPRHTQAACPGYLLWVQYCSKAFWDATQ